MRTREDKISKSHWTDGSMWDSDQHVWDVYSFEFLHTFHGESHLIFRIILKYTYIHFYVHIKFGCTKKLYKVLKSLKPNISYYFDNKVGEEVILLFNY